MQHLTNIMATFNKHYGNIQQHLTNINKRGNI